MDVKAWDESMQAAWKVFFGAHDLKYAGGGGGADACRPPFQPDPIKTASPSKQAQTAAQKPDVKVLSLNVLLNWLSWRGYYVDEFGGAAV